MGCSKLLSLEGSATEECTLKLLDGRAQHLLDCCRFASACLRPSLLVDSHIEIAHLCLDLLDGLIGDALLQEGKAHFALLSYVHLPEYASLLLGPISPQLEPLFRRLVSLGLRSSQSFL